MTNLTKLLDARNKLMAHIHGMQGVITVGLGQSGGTPSLVIFTDSRFNCKDLPSEYEDFPIIVVPSQPANAQASLRG